MRYRSKPSEVEATQWTGDNEEEIHLFMQGGVATHYFELGGDKLFILAGKDGAQNYVPVPVGHWIVRNPGDLSDHWPVDPEYFAKKYEPLNEPTREDIQDMQEAGFAD